MAPLRLLVIADPAPHLRPLQTLPGAPEVTVGNSVETLRDAAERADIVVNGGHHADVLRALWPSLRSVRWVHSMAAGVENQVFSELADSAVPLTNSRGIYARSLAEWAVGAMLFFAKDLRRLVRQQEQRTWMQFDVAELCRSRAAIIGYGSIGQAIAHRLRAFGTEVVGVRRHASGAAEIPVERRIEAIRGADYVVVAAPLTAGTRGLIGTPEFEAMQRSAVLINVGRGPVVQERALIDALRSERIRGAALDVFDTEPLPADHPFWSMDNVLLSPHSADHTATWLDEAVQFFVDNYNRFIAGEALRNVVDKKAGY